MKYGFGIDLGGTTVKIAYFDETGKMLEKWENESVSLLLGGEKETLILKSNDIVHNIKF